MSTDEERAVAKEAQQILSLLTPSTPRLEKNVLNLAHAATVATEGSTEMAPDRFKNFWKD
jgi:hypothetical protein